MNGEKHNPLTFAILDREKGISELPPATSEEYPLPAWYRAVREIPLEELSVEDICKACRQQIHLEQVVPMALRILQSNPVAGEMYDGELLVSLKSVPIGYWLKCSEDATTLKEIVEKALALDATSDDVRQDAKEVLNKATHHQ
jgi:hypothetical protein